MPNFKEYMEGWIFCCYRPLLYKWERARAIAKDDAELLQLTRVEDKLRQEFSREMHLMSRLPPGEVDALVTQSNGTHYAGALIDGRFQVMESFIGSNYYIVDHQRDDLCVRVLGPASDVRRFQSVAEAEAFINPTKEQPEVPKKPIVVTVPDPVLKKAVATGKTIGKAAAVAKPVPAKAEPKKLLTPPAKKAAPVKAPAPVAKHFLASIKTKAAAPVAVVKPPVKAVKPGASVPVKVGVRTAQLVLEGRSNESVIRILQKEYPDKANSDSNVTWYRNKLKRDGMTLPPINPRLK